MIQNRDFAERMALQMLLRFRLALQNVQRHLLELRDGLLGKQHLDSAHVRGAVEAPENHFRHEFAASVLEQRNHILCPYIRTDMRSAHPSSGGRHGLYLASQSVVSVKTSRCCSDNTGKCGEPG